jgi:hypothetical protein
MAAEQRRRQASQVFLRVRHSPPVANSRTAHVVADVTNTSGQPIYQVHLRWFHSTGNYYVPPAEPEESNPLPRLDPVTREAKWTIQVSRDAGIDTDTLTATAEFRDAAEVWWRIDPEGHIEEIPAPAPPSAG